MAAAGACAPPTLLLRHPRLLQPPLRPWSHPPLHPSMASTWPPPPSPPPPPAQVVAFGTCLPSFSCSLAFALPLLPARRSLPTHHQRTHRSQPRSHLPPAHTRKTKPQMTNTGEQVRVTKMRRKKTKEEKRSRRKNNKETRGRRSKYRNGKERARDSGQSLRPRSRQLTCTPAVSSGPGRCTLSRPRWGAHARANTHACAQTHTHKHKHERKHEDTHTHTHTHT